MVILTFMMYLTINLAAEPYINKLYKDIGLKWAQLAKNFDFDSNNIDKIKDEETQVDNQCHSMLYQCHQNKGSDFTKMALAEALVKVGLLAVAERRQLLERYKPDNFKETKVDNLQNEDSSGKKNNLWIDY